MPPSVNPEQERTHRKGKKAGIEELIMEMEKREAEREKQLKGMREDGEKWRREKKEEKGNDRGGKKWRSEKGKKEETGERERGGVL